MSSNKVGSKFAPYKMDFFSGEANMYIYSINSNISVSSENLIIKIS